MPRLDAFCEIGKRTRVVADLLDCYGLLIRPRGMTDDELVVGLIANMNRIRASRTLEMVTAISIVAAGESSMAARLELMKAAGLSDKEIADDQINQFLKRGMKGS